jgi:hypothetical protein
VGQKMQPTKLPKCGFTLSQAFIITGEEVEETVVGCCSEHRIESTRGSSYSVKEYYKLYICNKRWKQRIKNLEGNHLRL